jgi:hypothetical protein
MAKVWRRIISVLEIVGGAFGIVIVAWELAVRPLDVYTPVLGGFAISIYLLSLIAGVLLWLERPAARVASIVTQGVQLPKLISPPLTFTFSFGFDLYPYVQSAAGFLKLGFDLKLLAFHQLFLNMEGAPVGIGISIPASVFLIMLFRYKPVTVWVAPLPPPPPSSSAFSENP